MMQGDDLGDSGETVRRHSWWGIASMLAGMLNLAAFGMQFTTPGGVSEPGASRPVQFPYLPQKLAWFVLFCIAAIGVFLAAKGAKADRTVVPAALGICLNFGVLLLQLALSLMFAYGSFW